ncbi:peptidoglycan-binding protein [Actinospica sp. MGRD01-02]|uniref:Peptidoglycan-binding protein n=1 Tax=Actinospica acidithermotolerans TaxID=2828514 RepID=A0A941IIR8_9ACTN|nr:peptidoglycan-binding protein [Actinospica acidithermotolerans]MBR7828629.1 peptidoglycan-binding protein [Actinospica acidithermotolerans]
MEYCGNCGEPVEGRFCRMCGSPVGGVTSLDTQAMAAVSAGQGAEWTEAMPGFPAAAYGARPTQLFNLSHEALTQPPSEFDSLFRTPDGAPGLHGQTQVLPPVVETDYRMQPPGGNQSPPSPYDDEDERSGRPVVLATVGAVVVAAAVILGLLYLGNQSGGSGSNTASGSTTAQSASAAATSMQAGGVITVPMQSAQSTSAAASTPAAPSTSSAAVSFSGDSLPLGPGSQGSLVRWVQERLSSLGYYQGAVTGSFDQATALAVQQFQAASGVTGDAASTVGDHTRLALAAAGPTPSLRYGDRDSDVSRLNQSLDYAEGAGLSGNRYTMTTAEAVAFYQQAVGLQVTGSMNSDTWSKLQTGTLAGSAFSGGGSQGN